MKRPGPATIGMVALLVGLTAQQVRISQGANEINKVLNLAEANHVLLDTKNTALQTQVDASRVILTQLYAALNASQRQVESLGGTPIHFEFEVPTTTTTTTPVPGSPPTTGPSTSQNASGPPSPPVFAIEALIISPVSVSLPPEVTVPPALTLPPVSIPSELTLPPFTIPSTTVPPVGATLP